MAELNVASELDSLVGVGRVEPTDIDVASELDGMIGLSSLPQSAAQGGVAPIQPQQIIDPVAQGIDTIKEAVPEPAEMKELTKQWALAQYDAIGHYMRARKGVENAATGLMQFSVDQLASAGLFGEDSEDVANWFASATNDKLEELNNFLISGFGDSPAFLFTEEVTEGLAPVLGVPPGS